MYCHFPFNLPRCFEFNKLILATYGVHIYCYFGILLLKFSIVLSLVCLLSLILLLGHKLWTLRVLLLFDFTFDFDWHVPLYSLVAAHWDCCVLPHDSISTKRQPRMRPSLYTICLVRTRRFRGLRRAFSRLTQHRHRRQAKNGAGQGAVATDAAKCPDFWLIVTYMFIGVCLCFCLSELVSKNCLWTFSESK